MRPVISVLPAVGLGYVFYLLVQTPSWPLFGGEVAAICGVVAVAGYFLCLDPEHRALAYEKVRRVFQKEPLANEV